MSARTAAWVALLYVLGGLVAGMRGEPVWSACAITVSAVFYVTSVLLDAIKEQS